MPLLCNDSNDEKKLTSATFLLADSTVTGSVATASSCHSVYSNGFDR